MVLSMDEGRDQCFYDKCLVRTLRSMVSSETPIAGKMNVNASGLSRILATATATATLLFPEHWKLLSYGPC
jgi:hypothetical protein